MLLSFVTRINILTEFVSNSFSHCKFVSTSILYLYANMQISDRKTNSHKPLLEMLLHQKIFWEIKQVQLYYKIELLRVNLYINLCIQVYGYLNPFLYFKFWLWPSYLLFFFVEKGYFSAPLKVPAVPSSHCKRTAFDNSVPAGPCFTDFDLHWTGPGALRYPS